MNDQSKRTEPEDSTVEAALREFLSVEKQARQHADAETPHNSADDSTKLFAAQAQETFVPPSAGKRALESEGQGASLAGQFGRYRIIRLLGKGGMGTVYLAEDTLIQRQVALKIPHLAEFELQRFLREARSAGQLRHPNICPIYDFGQIDGMHFITMAYIEGRPLSALIQSEKPQSERQILVVIRKLALALQAAHDKGIVHRDLKPANIMVDTTAEPIIMDFGLARQAAGGDDIRLTETGTILGTPAFMSPEQVQGEPDKIGPATDQYSLGVILYELLTGQLPFQGPVFAVVGQILTKEPPRSSQLRPGMDPRIETVCRKMMAKTPADRFASLKAVADELGTILKNPAAKASSKVQPEHHLPREIPEKPFRIEEATTSPQGVFGQFRRPLNAGGWIPWSVVAFGLAIFAVMAAVVVSFRGNTAVENDSQVPGVKVAAPSTTPSPIGDGKINSPPPTPSPQEKTTATHLPPAIQPPAATLPPTFKNNLGMEFLLVPKGKSWLGGGGGRPGDQEVVIAHDFYLGKYEVTQDEWEQVTGLTPSWFSRTGAGKEFVKDVPDTALKRFPVENVTLDDVQVFLERLNKREKDAGWVYRLPHVVEWEYVCRGGPLADKSESAYDYYSDRPLNQLVPQLANINRTLQRTCKVGSYGPNRLGFFDMHGNVWEWCHDPEKITDGPASHEPRGGGWSTAPEACTAAHRLGPARWEGRVGLRLARGRQAGAQDSVRP